MDTRRFLIARMSAVGDTILTLPVACALRDQFRHAYIAWVVERKASPMVLGHPCLDEVFVLERGWFTRPRALLAARRLLRSRGFHVAIDCQGMTKSALACWLSAAPLRIGHAGPAGRELSRWLNNRLVESRRAHVTDRALELLAPLGICRPEVRWELPITDAARSAVRQAILTLGLQRGYAVINPGASWESKLWEMDRFAAVARHLGERHGLPVLIVWGSGRERGWAEHIVAASGGHAVAAPPTNLTELAALVREARLFISGDTGPLHMAVAVGTPTIGLYGPTRAEECGPYGKPHVAIQVQYQSGSHKQRRRAGNWAMRLITAEMVCQQCDVLLQPTDARHCSQAP